MIERNDGARVIILGALSAIGNATARLYAKEGAHLVLVGRSVSHLQQMADDLQARGARRCTTVSLDLANVDDPHGEMQRLAGALPGPVDAIMLFYGVLGDQAAAESDVAELGKIIRVNFSSAAEWCIAAAALLERQNHGTLIAVSSVAGDRGRQSNYVYGAAKAGLTVLVEGIAHRLAKTKARAVAVKLGFVDTPMTAHIQKGGPLWAKPEDVARRVKQIAERPSGPTTYVPSFWRPIMLVVRNIPSFIFLRTKL